MQQADISHTFLTNSGFRSANLQGADFTKSTLRKVGFINAKLEGAIFIDTDLTDSRMYGATISNETNFKGANWWEANFYYVDEDNNKETMIIDSHLLNKLYQAYKEAIPKVPRERHSSVNEFLKGMAL